MDKEQAAIQRLQEASAMSFQIYGKPLIVTTSGGKDSSVCVALAQRAGIPFEVLHNHTTADAPDTVRFVRSEFKRLETDGRKCSLSMPVYKRKRTSMWELIPLQGVPPTRIGRYCCKLLKERNSRDSFIVTGIRWEESVNRKNNRGIYEAGREIILSNDNDEKRQAFESCAVKAARVCNPIIDWTDRDVWDYIQAEKIPTNPLYEEGLTRVGCIGCPMAGTVGRYAQFARWPKYRNAYMMAFGKMLETRRRKCLKTLWETADDVFHWWMEDGVLPGQIGFDDLETEEDDG